MQKESSSGYKLQANDVRIEKQMHSNGPFAFLTRGTFLLVTRFLWVKLLLNKLINQLDFLQIVD